MASNLLEALRGMGMDTQAALRRFAGNAALYERFVLKFPEDDSFQRTGEALRAGDWDAMLTAAHTLKGVAGNLGLPPLYLAAAQIVALLRAGDRDGAAAAYAQLESAYQRLCPVLELAAREEA